MGHSLSCLNDSALSHRDAYHLPRRPSQSSLQSSKSSFHPKALPPHHQPSFSHAATTVHHTHPSFSLVSPYGRAGLRPSDADGAWEAEGDPMRTTQPLASVTSSTSSSLAASPRHYSAVMSSALAALATLPPRSSLPTPTSALKLPEECKEADPAPTPTPEPAILPVPHSDSPHSPQASDDVTPPEREERGHSISYYPPSSPTPHASPDTSVDGSPPPPSHPPSVHLTSINLRLAGLHTAGAQSPCPSPLDLTSGSPLVKPDIHHELDDVTVYRAIAAYHREHRDEGLGPSWYNAHQLLMATSEREREKARRRERVIRIRERARWWQETGEGEVDHLARNPTTIVGFLRAINA